ncbi:GNAT family N-acetyltransferase [Aureimonas pseudogalii]|uniref:Putative GNAT family N-acyltransferase n=1 Tax=Aureimonas pseudogalii TaxID=1744844 RepID=A0A7W6H7Y8_9HYPH|nr:GNAT family N-acetyltransferase [Aureimonas pseudogalii]MBB4000091.1 putative GNAT family N-acyltransferase [Aureimonas pseudogalii]
MAASENANESNSSDRRNEKRRYERGLNADGTGLVIVHGMDDFLKMAVVRAAVYMGEKAFAYAQQFDGNDFAATHLLYSKKHEPAGCIRIRFFGEFAKMERLAVRKEFRTSRIAFELVRAAVDLCRAKGYTKLYGHASEDVLDFWLHFGFKIRNEGETFELASWSLIEMEEDVEPFSDAVRIGNDPVRTIRPEGQWDEPCALERPSTLR